MRRIHVAILCCALSGLTALTALTLPWPAQAASSYHHAVAQHASVRVAFTGTDGNIYVMDDNGAHRTQITTHAGPRAAYPWYAWSPDHRYLLLLRRNTTSYNNDILVLNRDGSLRSTVVRGSPGGSFYPAWARDGNVIAYVAAVETPGATVTVNRVGVDGTTSLLWQYQTTVTECDITPPTAPPAILYQNELPGFVTYSLEWSAGAHYAIYGTGCTGTAVQVTDLKTGKTQRFRAANQVVQAPSAALYAVANAKGIQVYRDSGSPVGATLVGALPAWSPNSRYLYFVQYRKGYQCTIFKAEIRTHDVTQMIPWQQNVYSFGPLHVTPDGHALIFSRIDVIDSAHARVSIQRLDAGGLTTLARDASRPAL